MIKSATYCMSYSHPLSCIISAYYLLNSHHQWLMNLTKYLARLLLSAFAAALLALLCLSLRKPLTEGLLFSLRIFIIFLPCSYAIDFSEMSLLLREVEVFNNMMRVNLGMYLWGRKKAFVEDEKMDEKRNKRSVF